MSSSLFTVSANNINIDLCGYGPELDRQNYSFLSETFDNVKSVNKIEKNHPHGGYTERQVFSTVTSTKCTLDTEVYTFKLSKEYSISHTFSLYDPSDPYLFLDFLQLQVYSKKKGEERVVYETISRESLSCWIRLFKQHTITLSGECLLPIFLNRSRLNHYTEWLPQLVFEFTFKKNSRSRSPLLCYRGRVLFARHRSEYATVFSEPIYYFYDCISDVTRCKKWTPLEKEITSIYLAAFSEGIHRMSDLFIIVRNMGTTTTTRDKCIKRIDFYAESSLLFTYDTQLLSTIVSPVDKWKSTHSPTTLEGLFAPEITEVYYLPFSTISTPFETYIPRPYFNTQGVANFTVQLITHDNYVGECEVSLCYLSPTQIKAN